MKLRLAVTALLLVCALEAAATTVLVMSVNPEDVSLVINGSTMRTLRAGETSPEGVRVLFIRGEWALVEVDGRRWEMRMGSRTTSQVVLQADAQGHFITTIYINGQPVRAMVDTGASTVGLNMVEARRVNVNFTGAQRGMVTTAGGLRAIWRVNLATVQLGDIVIRNIEGGVTEGGTEQLSVVLLGMSFLNHLEMQRSGKQLILIQKH